MTTPPPPPPPPPPPLPAAQAPRPVQPRDREPILDLLRGVALLGILLVNIELMRGPSLFDALAGALPAPVDDADRITSFLVGWLAAGKFVSSFAILFGVGAALLTAKAWQRGWSAHRLLARRYLLLAVFGLAHMVLLFPGDILFVYALTGFALLPFLDVRPRTALWWSGGLVAALAAVATLATAFGELAGGDGPEAVSGAVGGFFDERRQATIAAYTDGGFSEVLTARSFEALVIQTGQLTSLPWLLALFLLGFATARSGVATDPGAARGLLRRLALVGLGVGLPANLVLGVLGPVGTATGTTGEGTSAWIAVAAVPAQLVAAPLLAVGYLAGLALLALRFGTWRPVAAVGQMALTAYLLQSLVAAVVFVGWGTYDAWTATSALVVVAASWALLLVVCPLWLRRHRFGPVEWLWRSWTYRGWQPLRRAR
ncbi:MAG: DUF418 domain-containing protein [Nitriliruptoraceae bacterium]